MSTVFIACGGTGGHLFPGIALAEKLQERGHAVRLYVSQKPIDARVLADYPQFEAVRLPVIGWQGFNLRLGSFLISLFKSYRMCLADMKKFSPVAVMAMGGFSSAPPLWAARRGGVGCYLHESNAIPGRVTRYFSRKVTKVFLGFEEAKKYLSGARTSVVGTPINRLLVRLPREQAADRLHLDSQKKTLTIMGGSQGACSLNTRLMQGIEGLQISWENWQVIHLTGAGDQKRVEAFYHAKNITAYVVEFSSQMSAIYSITDLMVSRCGASSLAEISAFGLASVLIPFPFATDDHQTANAEVFVKHGASVLIQEKVAEALQKILQDLLGDDVKRAAMGAQAARLYRPDALGKIMEELTHATA